MSRILRVLVLLFALGIGLSNAPRVLAQSAYPYAKPVPNDSVTGTTQFTLTKINSSGNAVIMGTSDVNGYSGVCVANCGKTGTAWIAFAGLVPLIVDGTAAIDHYITISSTTGGDGHDTGAITYPASGAVIGRIQTGSTGAGSVSMIDLFSAEVVASSAGTSPGAPTLSPQINAGGGLFAGQSNTVVVNGGSGAIGALTLAANEHVVLSANDTETATISNALNGLVIEGVAPTISITRQTASTGIFNLSGNDIVLRQLTLDGGSVATPLPLVALSGNRPLMEKIIPQNAGTTSPAKAIVLVTAGTGGKFLDLYYPSDSDTGIYLLPSASATIQDVWIERFLFASHAPATNLCAIDGNDGASSSAIKDIHFVENTVYMNSANASGICFHGQTIANDASPSPNHFWDKDLVVPLANGNDAYHIFVQSRDSFTNNMYEDYNGFTVANPYTFGDSYNSKFIGNDCHNQKGSNVCYKWTDFQFITVLGNNGRGLGGTTNFQYSWTSTSGVGSNSVIAHNSCRLDQTNAGTCYRFQAASGSFNMLDDLFEGNMSFGTSTAGQVGLQLTDTTGTLGNFYAQGNHFSSLATGINIGAGVTNAHIGEQHFDTVTTPVTDSGTTSSIQTTSFTVTGTLSGGTLTVTFPIPFSGATTYTCSPPRDTTTPANAVTLGTFTATTVVVTGTGTDNFTLTCSGR